MPNIKNKTQPRETKSQLAKADRIGKGIRKTLDNIIENPKCKMMQKRLSSAVLKWLKAPDPHVYSLALDNFSFTVSPIAFHKIFNVSVQVYDLFNGYTVVKIPKLVPIEKIKAPAGTNTIFLCLTVGVCDALTGKVICSKNFATVFLFKNREYEEKICKVKTPKTKGNLLVTGISMRFWKTTYDGKEVKTETIGKTSGMVAARYRS
jgi:hypothetical protein